MQYSTTMSLSINGTGRLWYKSGRWNTTLEGGESVGARWSVECWKIVEESLLTCRLCCCFCISSTCLNMKCGMMETKEIESYCSLTCGTRILSRKNAKLLLKCSRKRTRRDGSWSTRINKLTLQAHTIRILTAESRGKVYSDSFNIIGRGARW